MRKLAKIGPIVIVIGVILVIIGSVIEGNEIPVPKVEDNIGETVIQIDNDSSFAWVHINGLRTGKEPDFYFITIPPYKYTVAVSYYGNVEVLNMELITKSESHVHKSN